MTLKKTVGKDAETASGSVWHKSAPQCVRGLCLEREAGEVEDSERYQGAWQAWAKHLRKRKEPVAPAKLFSSKTYPLTWALPEEFADCMSVAELSADDEAGSVSVDEEMICQWLDSGPCEGCVCEEGVCGGEAADLAYVLEALALSHALPRLAGNVSPATWWALLERLVSVAIDASVLTPIEHGMVSQLAGGELALTLAYLFPEITVCRKLARQARAVLSVGLVDLLDGQGMPHAGELVSMRPLLASWTRCRAMGATMKKGCFNTDAEAQYQWLIRQSLRLARADGSAVFSRLAADAGEEADRKAKKAAAQRCCDLFDAALRFGDKDDRKIAAEILPKWDKRQSGSALPEAPYHSEWAAVGVLRPDWSAAGARLTALFNGRSAVGVELSCGKNVVFSGPWKWDVSVDGKRLEPLSDWEEVCWVSDEDADYLELEMAMSEDVVLQRHMLMARDDGFLLMADSVLCEEESDNDANAENKPAIEYCSKLPLVPGIGYEPAEKSREALLTNGKKNIAHVLPLALPEWRSGGSPGTLERADGGLELKFSVRGNALFAPLFFDLDPRRFARRMTWRQLTVAESLQKRPADVAVGYRVQLGREQWLIYRSLAQTANRTLLGHNLSTEMLVARFDPAGEVEALVEIE